MFFDLLPDFEALAIFVILSTDHHLVVVQDLVAPFFILIICDLEMRVVEKGHVFEAESSAYVAVGFLSEELEGLLVIRLVGFRNVFELFDFLREAAHDFDACLVWDVSAVHWGVVSELPFTVDFVGYTKVTVVLCFELSVLCVSHCV